MIKNRLTILLLSACLSLPACNTLDTIDTTPIVFDKPAELAAVPDTVAREKENIYEISENKTSPDYMFEDAAIMAYIRYANEVNTPKKGGNNGGSNNGGGNNGGGNNGGSNGGGNSGSGSNNGGSNNGGSSDSAPQTTQQSTGDYASQVLALVNNERANAGLGGLSMTSELNAAAQKRAEEIISLFDHTRPDGTSCFTVFDEYGVSYGYAGENIAAGQRSPSEVMNSWMNSSGHRQNILGGNFNHIGIGVVHINGGYGYYWVQLFTD